MSEIKTVQPTLNDIVSLCKQRGFIFPSSEFTEVLPHPG